MLRTFASVLVIGVASLPRVVHAKDPSTVEAGANLVVDDAVDASHVTIQERGTLTVKPLEPGGGKGWLHLRATSIVIEAGGTITADAAGSAGVNGMKGDGEGGGLTATGTGPGGGAGFGGLGGQGTNASCVVNSTFGAGGITWGASLAADLSMMLGSAGGAGSSAGMSAGGRGGGAIVLEAATITILGSLHANGETPTAAGGGGGSGGTIHLLANVLEIGPRASIQALGGKGNGAAASPSGGGGGGGRIFIEAPPPPDLTVFDVSGGVSGACAPADGGAGQAGTVTTLPIPVSCFDLDGDDHYAQGGCPEGDDCDDVDDAILPGATEICDGVDNDCSAGGGSDGVDGEGLCTDGLECDSAARECREPAAPDAGTPTGGDAPYDIAYRGGCSVPLRRPLPVTLALGLAIGALVARAARRARRSRRR